MAKLVELGGVQDGSAVLSVEYGPGHDTNVFVHIQGCGFSYCHMFNHAQAKAMAEAFQKAAFLIEQNTPQVLEAA